METYKDTKAHKAILVCDAREVEQLANACFNSAMKWLNKSHKESETWKMDLDLDIAKSYGGMKDLLDQVFEDIKEEKTEE